MITHRLIRRALFLTAIFFGASGAPAAPVEVQTDTAGHAMVVAGHPEATAAGLAVLKAGGNAVDAAVAVSLALGVAEPYASGLGGKLVLLYYDAKSRRTYAVDGLDRAPFELDVAAYLKLPAEARSAGWTSVCVPGLAAGLWEAHQRWGAQPWAQNLQPAIELARNGFVVLPKTREFFAEQEPKLRAGDPEIARLYLPGGKLPETGVRLVNEDLARTMEILAEKGLEGFYRGSVAHAIAAAAKQGGGTITLEDLGRTRGFMGDPAEIGFGSYHLAGAPPPCSGPALFMTALKVLEGVKWTDATLRTADNLDHLGRAWRIVQPLVQSQIADTMGARFSFRQLTSQRNVEALRRQLEGSPPPVSPDPKSKTAAISFDREPEPAFASTTSFVIADAQGNIVCATQSLSQHFGAGVVAPGTGVVMNDTMSNFSFAEPKSLNYLAPGKRPRTTLAPTIVFKDRRPVMALGLPGSGRIPTAMLQVLVDTLVFQRPLVDAIGDTRFHFSAAAVEGAPDVVEAEDSLPAGVAEALRARGWAVELKEPAGSGRSFGGFNAIQFNADGTLTGLADQRRTNAAAGN
ncbi:MAG: gamma-glutamyltransferase [Opitutae bacterium]|nr:gamma-glutamyltransferase [Opitutae bacterium]